MKEFSTRQTAKQVQFKTAFKRYSHFVYRKYGMPINISILTTSDFPYYGAPENFVRQMSLGIKFNDADVEVIKFWGERYHKINDTNVTCTNYLFEKPFRNELLKFFEIICQIIFIPIFVYRRKYKKNDSVLLLYGLDRLYFNLPLIIFCSVFRLKCYRIITEIYPNYEIAKYWWRAPNILFNQLQLKYIDRYMDGIIVLTKFLYDTCVSNSVKKEKLLLIPNFIKLDNHEGVPFKISKFRIGFAGSPTLENGIIDLVDAFSILRIKFKIDLELVIIGDIKEEILSLINKYNFNVKDIHLTGLLNIDDVVTELNKCSVLVNPRRKSILAQSGFPTKIGEYFGTKKPVVTTRLGDLADYFADKVEVIFSEPDNPLSLAESIMFVYENERLGLDIGKNGYNWALTYLEFRKNSKKLIEFIAPEVSDF